MMRLAAARRCSMPDSGASGELDGSAKHADDGSGLCPSRRSIVSVVERLCRPHQLVRLKVSDEIALHHGVGMCHGGLPTRDILHLGEGLIPYLFRNVRPKRFYGVVILLLRSQTIIPGRDSLQCGAVVIDIVFRNIGTPGF